MAVNEQLKLFGARFDKRFLEDYIGKAILNDPRVALIELIANSWDANASEVRIAWPTKEQPKFSLSDDGCGLSEAEFHNRWMVMSYDRTSEQGIYAEPPARLEGAYGIKKRRVFGKNGKGRHGAFCFSGVGYTLETWKNGRYLSYDVFIPKDGRTPIDYTKQKDEACERGVSGIKITAENARDFPVNADEMRKAVGLRFLSDPDFKVWIDKEPITFSDVPSENVQKYIIKTDAGEEILIRQIDIKEADKTTRQHGIAWQVNRRLVGNVDWNLSGSKGILDGRSTAAKRFSFIVEADFLDKYVEADWSGFKRNEQKVNEAERLVGDKIQEILFEASKQQREETLAQIFKDNKDAVGKLASVERQNWKQTVRSIQRDCPSLSDTDVQNVASILAKMELSRSKYGLLEKLDACTPDDIDSWDTIFGVWSVEAAKTVLNELETRLRLIDELIKKVDDPKTDEVQDLQPLFEKGLWIFGPEYEAVGFTSNKSMATVIREIFHKQISASRNRPDFVVTPNSSLGFYSYPHFDFETGEERSSSKLVMVELKAPSVPVGMDEKNQCLKYIHELQDKGLIMPETEVKCFVLGKTMQRHHGAQTKEGDHVLIVPMTYATVLSKAKSRTHMLYDKIKDSAPFLAKVGIDDENENEKGLGEHLGDLVEMLAPEIELSVPAEAENK